MDSEIFPTRLEDRRIVLETAADVVRFSFIVQNSISYLDLALSPNSKISYYFRSLYRSSGSRRLGNFLSTEERCRMICTPNRRLFYSLNLDLPRGRECSLNDKDPKSCNRWLSDLSTHIGEITLCFRFYPQKLSDFIEKALSTGIPKLKILKSIVKFDFDDVPLLSRLDIRTTSKFIDCFYPEVKDPELFEDFTVQFDIIEWIQVNEEPEILEYLLYHIRRFRNARLEDDESEIDLVNLCILNRLYLNIRPILKLISHPMPTLGNYDDYIFKISLERPRLTDNLLEAAEELISPERICLMMQIIMVHLDNRQQGYPEVASEALRLIWSSIPDACVTLGELKTVFGAAIDEQELTDVYDFYARSIDESHDDLEPRSLQHLCRTVLRGTFEENDVWIPEGISGTGLPELMQSFLNLEKAFVG